MKTWEYFLNSGDLIQASSLIQEDEIAYFEKIMNVTMGEQLKNYILQFGCIGYEFITFFGIIERLKERSSMVKHTLYLHEKASQTLPFIAFEDQGDGDFYLVDSEDNVYRYLESRDELQELSLKLNEYILERLNLAYSLTKQ